MRMKREQHRNTKPMKGFETHLRCGGGGLSREDAFRPRPIKFPRPNIPAYFRDGDGHRRSVAWTPAFPSKHFRQTQQIAPEPHGKAE